MWESGGARAGIGWLGRWRSDPGPGPGAPGGGLDKLWSTRYYPGGGDKMNQNDRVQLTWLGRFRAIQDLEGTSAWLAVALETVMERDPEDAKSDAELLWRLSAIRADEVMADTKELLEDVGL